MIHGLLALLLLVALSLSPAASLGDGPVPGDKQPKNARDQLFREAKKAARAGKYERAAQAYGELLVDDQADVQANIGQAHAYLKLQNYQQCFDHAALAFKTEPNSARAHALAGVALLRSGFVRAAVLELQKALVLDPKEPLAYGGAAEIDYYEGRPKEARAKSYYATRLDPEEPDFLLQYARASSRLEDFKEAADAYDMYLRIAPEADHERRDYITGLVKFYRQLSGLRIHAIKGPNLADVPFFLGSDRRPYIRLKMNGKLATFVIDTGSGFTVISNEAAHKFGVKEIAHGGKSQGVGGNGKFEIVYGVVKSLQLGNVAVRTIPCFIRVFHDAGDRPSEEHADGLIGLSVLSHFLVEIDYKNAVMRLNREPDAGIDVGAQTDATVVPFRTTQNGLISVETQLDDGQSINAIVDSAASSSVVSKVAVERLKLRDRIIKGQLAQVSGAAGITNDVEMLYIRKCQVAEAQQKNLRALVLDFGAINETSGFEQSGILGGDFLRHFRLTIDFNRARVAFQPNAPPPAHF